MGSGQWEVALLQLGPGHPVHPSRVPPRRAKAVGKAAAAPARCQPRLCRAAARCSPFVTRAPSAATPAGHLWCCPAGSSWQCLPIPRKQVLPPPLCRPGSPPCQLRCTAQGSLLLVLACPPACMPYQRPPSPAGSVQWSAAAVRASRALRMLCRCHAGAHRPGHRRRHRAIHPFHLRALSCGARGARRCSTGQR